MIIIRTVHTHRIHPHVHPHAYIHAGTHTHTPPYPHTHRLKSHHVDRKTNSLFDAARSLVDKYAQASGGEISLDEVEAYVPKGRGEEDVVDIKGTLTPAHTGTQACMHALTDSWIHARTH